MIELSPDLRETHVVGPYTSEQIISTRTCQALERYHLLMVGISSAVFPFRFVRPLTNVSQLLVCVSGRGMVWVDGQWQQCTAGTAYVTPPRVFHAYYALEHEPWQVCWLQFNHSLQSRAFISTDKPQLIHVDPFELLRAIEGLYHESMGLADESVMQHWAHLTHIYAQRMLGPKPSDGRLQVLWKHVDANLAYPWNNEELASRLNISSEHLRRLCQQQYGHSPMKQVTAMRMQRAMALLTTDSYTIESVALRVGYENPFAFSTAFKRYAGMSPSIYRDQSKYL